MPLGMRARAAFTGGLMLVAAFPALAREDSLHVLNIALPDGQVEQISYRAEVPPQIVVVPEEAALPMGFESSAFAELDRISAMMDRQMDAMMREVGTLEPLNPAAGAAGTTYVATFSSDGACTRSAEITYAPGMAKPREVSNVSGDCGSASGSHAPVLTRNPSPPAFGPSMPRTTLVRAEGASSQAALQDAVWHRWAPMP